ncbi:ATP-binding protein [Patescibacteria group bacterium]
MKIRAKVFLSFFISGLILTVAGSGIFYVFSKNSLSISTKNHLESVAQSLKDNINFFIEHLVDTIEIAATHKELSTEELKKIVSINHEFAELFVIDSDGKIITSSNNAYIGLNRSTDNYFVNAREKTYLKKVYFSEVAQCNSFTISTPHAGGVLVARIDLEFFNNLVSSKVGLGETEESLLAYRNENGDAVFFTDRKFSDVENEIVPKEDIEIPITQALAKKEQIFLDFKDYRNVAVIASTRYIEAFDLGLVVKIDESEAFANVDKIFLVMLGIIITILIVIVIISNWVSLFIGKPIKKLQEGTKIIAKGNLNYKVGTKEKDEIGVLSRAFDKMTVAIKRSRADVDRKVKEQTKTIREDKIVLENQQKAVLNVLEDVQEEKDKTIIEKEKTEKILLSIGDGVFVVDENYRIIVFNHAAEDISGFTAKEAIGKRYDEILKFIFEKNGKINDKFIKDAMRMGEVQEMANHTVLIRKDKTKLPVADSAAPIKDKDGNITGCIVVFRDVSQDREIDRTKTEFVSLASHQLRTPLSSIKWYLEIFQEEVTKKLDKEEKEYLTQISHSNERMIDLVNELLNVSRFEMGTLKMRPTLTGLKQIANTAIKELVPRIKEKKQHVRRFYSEGPINLHANPKLMRMVFQNLFSNAVKYTPNGGKIDIIIKKDAKTVLIKVADTGYGIPKSQQNNIFTKLFRADNIKEIEATGTGLGLYIVKKIVEDMGGKIWFKSIEKKGTTFYIQLPILKAQKTKSIKMPAK